jgi:protein-arginine kinase activator protein McsA
MKTRIEVSETYQLETENRQLKETIVELRTKLEASQFQHAAKVRDAVSTLNDEMVQFPICVGLLRLPRSLERRELWPC